MASPVPTAGAHQGQCVLLGLSLHGRIEPRVGALQLSVGLLQGLRKQPDWVWVQGLGFRDFFLNTAAAVGDTTQARLKHAVQ